MSGEHLDFDEIADRRAVLNINMGVLHDLLGLPGNCKLIACSGFNRGTSDTIVLYVVCSDFLPVEAGNDLPLIDAVFKTENGRPVFVAWETRNP